MPPLLHFVNRISSPGGRRSHLSGGDGDLVRGGRVQSRMALKPPLWWLWRRRFRPTTTTHGRHSRAPKPMARRNDFLFGCMRNSRRRSLATGGVVRHFCCQLLRGWCEGVCVLFGFRGTDCDFVRNERGRGDRRIIVKCKQLRHLHRLHSFNILELRRSLGHGFTNEKQRQKNNLVATFGT